MLAVPASVDTHGIVEFTAPFIDVILRMRIIRDRTPNQYMILLTFVSQRDARNFYFNLNNQPFRFEVWISRRLNSVFVHVCCCWIERLVFCNRSKPILFGIPTTAPVTVVLRRLCAGQTWHSTWELCDLQQSPPKNIFSATSLVFQVKPPRVNVARGRVRVLQKSHYLTVYSTWSCAGHLIWEFAIHWCFTRINAVVSIWPHQAIFFNTPLNPSGEITWGQLWKFCNDAWVFHAMNGSGCMRSSETIHSMKQIPTSSFIVLRLARSKWIVPVWNSVVQLLVARWNMPSRFRCVRGGACPLQRGLLFRRGGVLPHSELHRAARLHGLPGADGRVCSWDPHHPLQPFISRRLLATVGGLVVSKL